MIFPHLFLDFSSLAFLQREVVHIFRLSSQDLHLFLPPCCSWSPGRIASCLFARKGLRFDTLAADFSTRTVLYFISIPEPPQFPLWFQIVEVIIKFRKEYFLLSYPGDCIPQLLVVLSTFPIACDLDLDLSYRCLTSYRFCFLMPVLLLLKGGYSTLPTPSLFQDHTQLPFVIWRQKWILVLCRERSSKFLFISTPPTPIGPQKVWLLITTHSALGLCRNFLFYKSTEALPLQPLLSTASFQFLRSIKSVLLWGLALSAFPASLLLWLDSSFYWSHTQADSPNSFWLAPRFQSIPNTSSKKAVVCHLQAVHTYSRFDLFLFWLSKFFSPSSLHCFGALRRRFNLVQVPQPTLVFGIKRRVVTGLFLMFCLSWYQRLVVNEFCSTRFTIPINELISGCSFGTVGFRLLCENQFTHSTFCRVVGLYYWFLVL